MNQKDDEIMRELKPLETLWSPLSDEKSVLYCKQLQPFDIAVIRKAVERVSGKWDRLSFPPPAVIIEACGVVNGTVAPGGGVIAGNGKPWEKRVADQAAMVAEYVTKYMRDSAMAAQAREEKWEQHLHRYVRVVADVQAQFITKRPNGCSWSHQILPEVIGSADVDKFLYGFFKDQRRQADTGTIDVAVPMDKIEQWQQAAYREQRAQAGEAARMAKKYGTSLAGALPTPGAPPPIDGIEQLVGRVGSDNTGSSRDEPPVWVDDSHDYARDVMANT